MRQIDQMVAQRQRIHQYDTGEALAVSKAQQMS